MMCGLIDLNTLDNDSDEVETTTSSSAECCLELWHACAGPSTCLPKKGNAVVYCPQGHLEQLHSGDDCVNSGDFSLSPHVFCRVVDVKLHVSLIIVVCSNLWFFSGAACYLFFLFVK